MTTDDFYSVNEDVLSRFEEKFGRCVNFYELGGREGYEPRNESFSEYHEDDGTYLVFPIEKVALDAAGLEDIMRRSLEQGKDLLFPLVKPYAWRTEPEVDY